jgi:hypothetical protein
VLDQRPFRQALCVAHDAMLMGFTEYNALDKLLALRLFLTSINEPMPNSSTKVATKLIIE